MNFSACHQARDRQSCNRARVDRLLRPPTLAVIGVFALLLAGVAQAQRPDSVQSAHRDSVAQALRTFVVQAADRTRGRYSARRTTSATRTETLLRDVPQSVSIVSKELIADQSMQSMADVVRYIPGITMGLGEGHRDAPTIRGNASTADFFIDGVRDDAQYLRDLYNVERIEALKGANAMTFGRGGGGGVLNRVSKEAVWGQTRNLVLEGGSFNHKRAMLDLGQDVTDGAAVRLNAMLENSDGFRVSNHLQRRGINPTAAFLVSPRTMVRLSYEYLHDERTIDRGIPSYLGAPSVTDRTTFFGNPSVNISTVRVRSAVASIDHTTAQGLRIVNRTRAARYDKFYQNSFPGAVSSGGAQVAVLAYNHELNRRNLFNQSEATYKLGNGSVQHTLLAGAEFGAQGNDQFRNTGYFNNGATSLLVPFSAPTVTAPVVFRQTATDADNASTVNASALYAQDQLSLFTHWQLIAGVRAEKFNIRFHNNRDNSRLARTDNLISPRVGLVYKPIESMSLYGSVSRSYLPSSGDQFAALTVTTSVLEPERFTNREFGLKWDVTPTVAVTAASYRLDRTNTSAADPQDATRIVQTGAQRTNGFEVGVAGDVRTWWQVAGGFAAQKARIVSPTTAAKAGLSVPLVPHTGASLWNRVKFARGIGAGLGLISQGRMYAAIDNTVTLPGFTRVDAALYAQLYSGVRAQLNLENAFDRRYIATSHGNNNIMPGTARTLRLSLNATR